MKLLEYKPEMEETHYAELNALDDDLDPPEFSLDDGSQFEQSDALKAPVVDVESDGAVVNSPGRSVAAQPSNGDDVAASWQVVSDTESNGQGNNIDDVLMNNGSNLLAQDVGLSAERYDAVLEQAHISNLLASQNNSLPWELGVHAAIFSDTWDVVQHQNLGVVAPPELPEIQVPEPENPVVAALERMKRKNSSAICDKVIRALPDKDFNQVRAELSNRALNKLLLVFTLACFPGELGTRVWNKFVVEQQAEEAKEILRDVLGNKSPNTVNKRASSILALINWLHGRDSFSWPLQVEGVLDFMNAETRGKKSLSRGKALLGSLRFFRHVMQFEELDSIINDPQLVGRAKRLDGLKTEIHQARPLKLSKYGEVYDWRFSRT